MAPLSFANEGAPQTEFVEPVAVSLVSEENTVQPGETFWVALHVKVEPHWHAYWKNPGDAGMPLTVNWSLPDGFKVGEISWPTPSRFALDSAVGFGYENEAILLAKVTAPKSFTKGTADLAAEVRWVVCNSDTCLPGASQAAVTLAAGAKEASRNAEKTAYFQKAHAKLPKQDAGLVVTRKDNSIQIEVPNALLGSKVTKAEYFPEPSTSVDTHAEPEWLSGGDASTHGKVVVPDNGDTAYVKGVVVLHTDGDLLAYEVNSHLPPSKHASEISMTGPSGDTAIQPAPHADQNDLEFQGGFLLAVALAFVGGMILNLMPCVLPVISFKVLGFIKMAGESRRLIFEHGLAFCVGVLLSFWTLAGALLILQSYGKSVGWGFQLQEPMFVMVLASFVFIFALSLFGVFEMGTSLTGLMCQSTDTKSKRNELMSSFFSGIMATAVATPCTGPFLGSAVGFAVTLPPVQAMTIFTSIGLGMSLPYLALAAFPSLLNYLPKRGAWMETFKQLMGFMMVATTLWLVWVFGAQMGTFALTILLAALFLFSVACWVYGRWGNPVKEARVRLIGQLVAAVIFAMGAYTAYTSASPWAEAMSGIQASIPAGDAHIAGDWEPFSPERVAELRKQGTPVFIDFTAKWCLICQANHLVLSTQEVVKEFAYRGIVRMKADWTKRDDMIAGELKKLGRNSVPLYVLYGKDDAAAPQILPQVLTKDSVTSALEQIEP